jgi:hypothetical protein
MKSKDDRKVNRIAKRLNKVLAADVFGDRFTVHQLRKTKESYYDIAHYLYELRDKQEPTRNRLIGWVNSYSASRELFLEMNDFIITSNFWELYRKQQNTQKG